ncbi:phage tail assembly chaperone [Sphingopyxis sp. MC1]|uniref:phage tail assembly chaperone n=1 Tax=Sphingopyxis sp. MC1 TaxID=1174684 RepID=UPI0002D206A5|nr:phage tail assembly chaperone [Sphingopyxis sp. MC1]ENY81914.1 putative phage tail fiber protein [Sphingopyxis sp. MC1]
MLLFSPSTCGFYDRRVHSSVPADAIEVSEAERTAALDALEPGLAIVAGPDGKPMVAPVAPEPEIALALVRARRDQLLRDSDYTQLPDVDMDAELRARWAEYRQTLRDLPLSITDGAPADWPVPPVA